jgi:hypothetical protein
VLAYVVPPEAIGAVFGLIQIVKVRERVATIEEWIRQQERRNGGVK